jgi:hypothetical protein
VKQSQMQVYLVRDLLTKTSVIPLKMSNLFILVKSSAVIEVKSSYDCSAKSSQQ